MNISLSDNDKISSMPKSLLGRVFHWGPLSAMTITGSVTYSTLSLSSPWLTKNNSSGFGMAIICIFIVSACHTLYNLWCAMLIGPGYLPLGWANTPDDNKKRIQITTSKFWPLLNQRKQVISKIYEEKDLTNEDKSSIEVCKICRGYKAYRAHHCRKCQRCVLKMDHHCPWINNCVGEMNHVYFIKFLISGILTTMQSSALLGTGIYRAFYIRYYFLRNDDPQTLVFLTITRFAYVLFNLGLSAGVVFAVTALLIQQLRAYKSDITLIEALQKDRGNNTKKNDIIQGDTEASMQKVKHSHFD